MTTTGIPAPTLRRLPMYYRELKRAAESGICCMNSKELGDALSIPSTQVRKDLSYLPEQGRAGVGYSTVQLAAYIESYLGFVNDKEAVLVGVGNLGSALVAYPGFEPYGLKIHALFDDDADKIGTIINGKEVLSVAKLTNLVQRMKIRIGIICTPRDAAQEIANQMIAGGIIAIWNFAPVSLKVPELVYVVNENLATEFAMLSYHVQKFKVANLLKDEAEPAQR
ncbi:MAG: redox-sensing transcriptional repressor Rex [Anaerolineaceae bacterium]|nr:redox-sensing transcriptional repressor Rex [Anaerolineaceae bacterium]